MKKVKYGVALVVATLVLLFSSGGKEIRAAEPDSSLHACHLLNDYHGSGCRYIRDNFVSNIENELKSTYSGDELDFWLDNFNRLTNDYYDNGPPNWSLMIVVFRYIPQYESTIRGQLSQLTWDPNPTDPPTEPGNEGDPDDPDDDDNTDDGNTDDSNDTDDSDNTDNTDNDNQNQTDDQENQRPTIKPKKSPTFSQAKPKGCDQQKPIGIPNIYQIDSFGTKAVLYWEPLNDYNDGYYIYYRSALGSEHGVEVKKEQVQADGAASLEINHLDSSLGYEFSVRGNNGCMPGDWGNSLKTQPNRNENLVIYYP